MVKILVIPSLVHQECTSNVIKLKLEAKTQKFKYNYLRVQYISLIIINLNYTNCYTKSATGNFFQKRENTKINYPNICFL